MKQLLVWTTCSTHFWIGKNILYVGTGAQTLMLYFVVAINIPRNLSHFSFPALSCYVMQIKVYSSMAPVPTHECSVLLRAVPFKKLVEDLTWKSWGWLWSRYSTKHFWRVELNPGEGGPSKIESWGLGGSKMSLGPPSSSFLNGPKVYLETKVLIVHICTFLTWPLF